MTTELQTNTQGNEFLGFGDRSFTDQNEHRIQRSNRCISKYSK
jgi:hypothetical protein